MTNNILTLYYLRTCFFLSFWGLVTLVSCHGAAPEALQVLQNGNALQETDDEAPSFHIKSVAQAIQHTLQGPQKTLS